MSVQAEDRIVSKSTMFFREPYDSCSFHEVLNNIRMTLERAKKEHRTVRVDVGLSEPMEIRPT